MSDRKKTDSAQHSTSLLPPSAGPFMRATEATGVRISTIPVDADTLWSPDRCPAHLLPYLAWACSVDSWDRNWPEETRRQVIRDAWMIHRHKGTISALRRIVEPLGYLIRVSEWWEFDGSPGTFTIEIGTLETGVSEELHEEMERLIADARPVSRHLVGLSIIQEIHGAIYAAAAGYDGDIITIYPED
ncbi:phage tail protein I [Escherichia coli]|uniref:Phage tail protein I n=15 Tax=Escherichia coli TaxID=562 RepID=A0A244BG94_ECOLX|nr:phage tail protein I [Escherichia coli]EEZ8624543.1 phage tail protein I [Escherichia coli O17]EFN8683871.1 phage tail protein I [Escherichia coli O119]AYW29904.1 phage tail protein I [Escherichia coli]EAC1962506.1 phage tail protein I [Escherichia coli]EEV5554358.1 phage tail protein I [Escherichia coli]